MSASDRAEASAIGGLLLAGLVVVLAATVGATYFAYADRLDVGGPMFASQSTVDIEVGESGGISSQELRIVHSGGQSVATDNLQVQVKTDEGTVKKDLPPQESLADGEWTAGENVTVPLERSEVCTGSDYVDLRLTYRTDSGRSYIVGSERVPVDREGFTLQNGRVVPNTEYSADVELLGTGFTYGAGGPRIDVGVDVIIDGTTYEPWPGNVNDGGGARSHRFTDQPAGAGLSVRVTGDPDGEYLAPRTRASTSGSGWVYTLRDGDTPPNIDGFGDQGDVASYVAPYVAADGTVSLASNEAIFLVELGNSQSGDAADYQDAVVLVTLRTEATETAGHRIDDEYVIVCPEAN